MITSIIKYVYCNHPDVKIVSASEVIAPKLENEDQDFKPLKFYDVTFEYRGKKFSKLFHTRLKESINEQFMEAVTRCDIQISYLNTK